MSQDARLRESAARRLRDPARNFAAALSRTFSDEKETDLRLAALYFLSETVPNGCAPALKAALADPEPRVRAAALAACDKTGAEELLDDIRKRFGEDADETVRREALYTLVSLGESRADGKPLAQALSADLSDARPSVRAKAIDLLGASRVATAADAIAALLKEDGSAWVRSRAAVALETLRARDHLSALIDALDDDSTSVATAALSALRTLTGERIGPDPDAWQAWLARQKGTTPPDADEFEMQ